MLDIHVQKGKVLYSKVLIDINYKTFTGGKCRPYLLLRLAYPSSLPRIKIMEL